MQHAAEVAGLRLLMLDTIVPGEEGGAFDAERLAWLEAELSAAPRGADPDRDAPPADRDRDPGLRRDRRCGSPTARAFRELVAGHPQVKRIVAGHVHRTIAGEVGGRSVLVAPSTYMQTKLELEPAEIDETSDVPAFAVHLLIGDELTSHVQPVSDPRLRLRRAPAAPLTRREGSPAGSGRGPASPRRARTGGGRVFARKSSSWPGPRASKAASIVAG